MEWGRESTQDHQSLQENRLPGDFNLDDKEGWKGKVISQEQWLPLCLLNLFVPWGMTWETSSLEFWGSKIFPFILSISYPKDILILDIDFWKWVQAGLPWMVGSTQRRNSLPYLCFILHLFPFTNTVCLDLAMTLKQLIMKLIKTKLINFWSITWIMHELFLKPPLSHCHPTWSSERAPCCL